MRREFTRNGEVLYHGCNVEVKIDNEMMSRAAKISINKGGSIFICHNNQYWIGEDADNKFKYRYSWYIGHIKDGDHICSVITIKKIYSYEERERERLRAIRILTKAKIIK